MTLDPAAKVLLENEAGMWGGKTLHVMQRAATAKHIEFVKALSRVSLRTESSDVDEANF